MERSEQCKMKLSYIYIDRCVARFNYRTGAWLLLQEAEGVHLIHYEGSERQQDKWRDKDVQVQ
jgi:hypothetical protein